MQYLLPPELHDLVSLVSSCAVINRLNLHDDMTPLLLELAPARWKVMGVLSCLCPLVYSCA
jgi:hypothetical protein